MASFCKQCSLSTFGEDLKEYAGQSTEEDTKNGLFAFALCEGCGYIQVDHEGNCVSPDCYETHGKKED